MAARNGEKMLVGQFGEIYPPHLDGVGGVMRAYCQALGGRGHRSLYVAPDNPGFTEDPGCETMLYPSLPFGKLTYRFGFPSLSPSFRKRLAGTPFDLVHAHAPFLAGRAARRVARKKGIPLVATFHSKYYDDLLRITHSRLLSRLVVRSIVSFYRSCDEVWTVNRRTARVLSSYGFGGEIVVVPNGSQAFPAPTDKERKAAEALFEEGAAALLFVGQQDYKKNPHQALRACALLKEQGVDFRLAMVGEGQDRGRLEALARELDISDRVRFTGRVNSRGALGEIYRRADLLVFPSLYDNAPLVVREAAAMGTPSLVAREGCAAEGIDHGVNGYLSGCDADEIARAIRKALPTCGETGRRAMETLALPWSEVAVQVEARYWNLIAKKRAEGQRRGAP